MMLLVIVMIICGILHLQLDLLLITELPSPTKLAIKKLVLRESKLIYLICGMSKFTLAIK